MTRLPANKDAPLFPTLADNDGFDAALLQIERGVTAGRATANNSYVGRQYLHERALLALVK
jgi:hypothetical protein